MENYPYTFQWIEIIDQSLQYLSFFRYATYNRIILTLPFGFNGAIKPGRTARKGKSAFSFSFVFFFLFPAKLKITDIFFRLKK